MPKTRVATIPGSFDTKFVDIELTEENACLATATARAEAAETKLARALQENDALVAQHNEMDERLAAAVTRAEAAEENAKQLAALAREYNAMRERTQERAQDMEAVMMRWQQRAEVAESERDDWKRRAEQWQARYEYNSVDAYNNRINEALRRMSRDASEVQP